MAKKTSTTPTQASLKPAKKSSAKKQATEEYKSSSARSSSPKKGQTTIAMVVSELESYADASLQESWDNAGLITGAMDWTVTGVLVSLDATEEVIEEAIQKGCNLVVAHHPIVFKGLKKLNGKNYVERAVIRAVKADIAIFAIHTNIDHAWQGVSYKMAEKIGLQKVETLSPLPQVYQKLYTYVPISHFEKVRQALFEAGAGAIGDYTHCSFSTPYTGTFLPGPGTNPYVGERGKLQEEEEVRLEVILEKWKSAQVIQALKKNHPYEEVAFDLISLENKTNRWGAGCVGELQEPMPVKTFLAMLQEKFQLSVIRHTALVHPYIKKVALCGGSGSFLISNALRSKAEVYITADLKYHEFFEAENKLILADIGHFESEQFTVELLSDILLKKFTNFAVLRSEVKTNPIQYFK